MSGALEASDAGSMSVSSTPFFFTMLRRGRMLRGRKATSVGLHQSTDAHVFVQYVAFAAFHTRTFMFSLVLPRWPFSLTSARGSTSVVMSMSRWRNAPELWRNGRLNERAQRRVGGLTGSYRTLFRGSRRHGEANYTSHNSCPATVVLGRIYGAPETTWAIHAVEDVEHVFIHCLRFTVIREQLSHLTSGPLDPETIVGFMLAAERSWKAVSSFASTVKTRLKNEERAKRR
ncbi:unnamed protein product [Trichogramma brassicae]|uniref:Uncharacterized protein n=1 Tax=Trichogramma brassicae TaxID=86971 RepID=A0A6H5HTY7_9HYME|nr:unnamed protein product [Trichogramma brassicae]CAB0027793.1 unnamed protein product [Trichogramma brassicae]